MDINSLISHDPATAFKPNPPNPRVPHNINNNDNSLFVKPLPRQPRPPVNSSIPPHGRRGDSAVQNNPSHAPSSTSRTSVPSGARPTPSGEPQHTTTLSTPGIDNRVNIALLPPQPPPPPIRTAQDAYGINGSPATLYPHVEHIRHEAPTPRTPPCRKELSSKCLSAEAQQTANQLLSNIQENPCNYEDRVKFIQILHQGFVDHIYPPSSPDSRGIPHEFDVFRDLRAAREELNDLFSIGEDLWAEWIQDESLLANTVQHRMDVTALCERSVKEEYASTKLWLIYGDWVLHLYNSATQARERSRELGQWSEEDRAIGREMFTWHSVLEVWREAAQVTQWRINDSHLIWNRYFDLLLQDVASSPSRDRISQIRLLFETRLQTPHFGWDQTFQTFSNFVSTYFNNNYETLMVEARTKAAEAIAIFDAREARESALKRAVDAKDETAEYNAYVEYIDWEKSGARRRQQYHFELLSALYQRVVVRYPSNTSFWEDYVVFHVESKFHSRVSISPLPSIHRATRHCPWSGFLWSQFLISAERAGKTWSDVENIKHQATRTGMLDAAGIEEIIKVQTTWCAYLRRRAFQIDSTDEDMDVAEMGMRSAIERVQEIGYASQNSPGDPLFRVERLYIRYLSERGSWDSARETFKELIHRHGYNYEFWLMYYAWEMLCWNKFTHEESSPGTSLKQPSPSFATAVLKQAIRREDLNWPEKIMETYMTHCEDYEDADELQLAIFEVRKAMKVLTKKRQEQKALEASTTAQKQHTQQQEQQEAPSDTQPAVHPTDEQSQAKNDGPSPSKRKRDESDINGISSKKPKPSTVETSLAPSRDREHGSVLVSYLPKDISHLKIRQFFRDCGKINSLKILPGENHTISALLEFNSREDALAALTKTQKQLEGNTISVEAATDTTIFVANFSPTADEHYIRELFQSYGEILEVRFPSLKYNTHRRFCYVQFVSSSAAYRSTELDGKAVEGDLSLIVKVSDPARRQDRKGGALEEGREIYLSNFPWKTTEADLVELFMAYGDVKSARIPTKANGAGRGFAFVAFSTKEQATAALAMNGQDYNGRELHVQPSTATGPKRIQATVISNTARSVSPAVERTAGTSPGSSTATLAPDGHGGDRRDRTLGLMNIPDTVNDSRIRALAEPHGPLVKIVLRPDHKGAIVEFADVTDAGHAALALEGYEIDPGRTIRVGTVQEMLKQSAEHKVDRIPTGKARTNLGKPNLAPQPSAPIKRPGQNKASFGSARRGGLRVNLQTQNNASPTTTNSKSMPSQNESQARQTSPATKGEQDDAVSVATPKKTNDDFRAMLLNKSTDTSTSANNQNSQPAMSK
ncbi:Splicing factor [Myotisia sp. PD_48]|nr:Splicing factor [Myotisia sp. PD_48]